MKKIVLFSASILILFSNFYSIPSHAALSNLFIQKIIDHRISPLFHSALSNAELGTFNQVLDHFNPSDGRHFAQRYAIYDQFAGNVSNPPVIFYECGEGNCLMNASNASVTVPGGVASDAQAIGAMVVILEHRYYGESQPFALMTTENLQYLTYEQALEDFAVFQRSLMSRPRFGGKWIFVGGSYSGALSAYYREKHPELVVGALSSSGVVRTEEAYEDYDLFVAKGLGPECLAAVQEVTHQVEQSLNNPDQLAAMKKLFGAEDIQGTLDFLNVPEGYAALAVQYGGQVQFCKQILSGDHLQGFVAGGAALMKAFQMTPIQFTPQGSLSIQAKDYEDYVGYRQWNYQSCVEFGGFAVPYHDPALRVSSALLDLNYQRGICTELFGITEPPQTARMNAQFYRPLLDPSVSNILFTNGSFDPYSPLSISPANGNATNPNTSTFMVNGGSHTMDLGTYRPDFRRMCSLRRSYFSSLR